MDIKLIHEVRAPKSAKELANIVKAQRIAERVLADTLSILHVGITEIEIENFIKESFIKYKAPVLSFSPIVAFGKNSANIHHTPTDTKLKLGYIIMLDFGTTWNHYCSDMTRTFFYGTPKNKKDKIRQDKLIKIYKDVLKANELAIAKIMRGEKNAKKIDDTARNFLAKKYKNNFKHGLGHGVGTVIHEWPNFKPNTTDTLPIGCVMTIEPGIYIRGLGGVRIEDMIHIKEKGGENLTNFPKDIKSIILKAN
jgi:Xaa-Pro aminopeptidase